MTPASKGNLLLVAPAFYDYHKEIAKELERQGHNVVFFPERPPRLMYSLTKKLPDRLRKWIFNKYLEKIERLTQGQKFDVFLLIRGEIVTPSFVARVREQNPGAYFVMYQWDSLRLNNYKELIPVFDRVMSFDYVDAETLSLEYIPLFYHPEYRIPPPDGQEPHDLMFIGSFSEDRYRVIRGVAAYSETSGINFFSYLYISPLDYVKLLLKGRAPRLRDVKFRQISREDILELYGSTKAILDIENARQTGLTMRTFEALATGRKFITTNGKAPALLPGYQANIRVVDRDRFVIQREDLLCASPLGGMLDAHALPNWIASILKEPAPRGGSAHPC